MKNMNKEEKLMDKKISASYEATKTMKKLMSKDLKIHHWKM